MYEQRDEHGESRQRPYFLCIGEVGLAQGKRQIENLADSLNPVSYTHLVIPEFLLRIVSYKLTYADARISGLDTSGTFLSKS